MNYNSWLFWALFALVLLPYWRLAHRHQNTLLLASSYVFYGFWDYRFLFLILLSTTIDFIGGLAIGGVSQPRRKQVGLACLLLFASLLLCTNIDFPRLWSAVGAADAPAIVASLPGALSDLLIPAVTLGIILAFATFVVFVNRQPEERRRKLYMVASITANLAILGFFKYFNFFATSFADGVQALGLGHPSWFTLHVLLPAGISFYTFQSMSYCIDIYRGHAKPTTNFKDFALFVCFFPHLVAGPIMRASTLLPQVVGRRVLRENAWQEGFFLVALGMFKKIVVADNLAPIVNAVYAHANHDVSTLSGMDVLIATYAFAIQIYCDFSGYSNVARGISKWLGFELVVNFKNPYIAQSPSDFWLRWHISLSSWLRDYLYIPLGGNRHGTLFTYRNLALTMLLGGLWHGANWTFIAWGAYHGVILCIYRMLGIPDVVPRSAPLRGWRVAGRVLLMLHLTCVGWLLFRAESIGSAAAMLTQVFVNFSPTSFAASALVLMLFFAAPLFVFEQWLGSEEHAQSALVRPWWLQAPAWSYAAIMLVVFQASRTSAFIYFQF